jgi:hypothetical protein
MLNENGYIAQDSTDPVGLPDEQPRPFGVVLGERDGCVARFALANGESLQFIVADRVKASLVRGRRHGSVALSGRVGRLFSDRCAG